MQRKLVADTHDDAGSLLPLDAPLEERRPTDEVGDEAVGGRTIEIPSGPDLLDTPVAHADDPVGDRHRLLLVMRDVDRGAVQLLDQALQLVAHILPQLGIEVAQRLVEQHDLGARDSAAGQRHALLLSATEHGRKSLSEPAKPDQGKHARRPSGGSRPWAARRSISV